MVADPRPWRLGQCVGTKLKAVSIMQEYFEYCRKYEKELCRGRRWNEWDDRYRQEWKYEIGVTQLKCVREEKKGKKQPVGKVCYRGSEAKLLIIESEASPRLGSWHGIM